METVTPNIPPTDFRRGRNRSRLGASVALLLAVALTVLLNLFSSRIYWRGTFKEERLSPLTQRTKSLLNTAAGDVELIGLFSASTPLRDSVAAMLSEFQEAAEGISGLHLTTRMVDPAANAAEAVAIRRRHNAPLSSIVVRSPETGSARVIAASQLLDGASGSGPARHFIADQRVALAICDLLRTETPKVVYFLTDAGAYNPREYDSLDGYSFIAGELRMARYDVETLDLSVDEVPEGDNILVLAGPRARLTRRAIERLTTALASGARLLLLVDVGGEDELDDEGLRALLGLWGVRVGGLLSRAETSSCRAVPWEEEKPNPIDLALGRTGGALTLGSPARAFFPAGESLPQTADRPRVRPLLAPRGDGNATGGAVAMAVEREASGTGVRSTRMVVVGDARFAANAMMSTGHDANRLFFLGCIDWLFQRDTAATAERSTPRVLHSAVTPDGWPWVVAAVVVVWPLAILLFTRLLLIRRP